MICYFLAAGGRDMPGRLRWFFSKLYHTKLLNLRPVKNYPSTFAPFSRHLWVTVNNPKGAIKDHKPCSGWWFQPIWNILVKMGSSSPNRDEHKKYLKPPPRCFFETFWCCPSTEPELWTVSRRGYEPQFQQGSTPGPWHSMKSWLMNRDPKIMVYQSSI